jgi:hypothetical protein
MDIIKSVAAIIFIATPHRGAHLSETLSRVLQCSFIDLSKKLIKDVSKNAFSLQRLNEEFAYSTSKLEMISFYETRDTLVSAKNARVVSGLFVPDE